MGLYDDFPTKGREKRQKRLRALKRDKLRFERKKREREENPMPAWQIKRMASNSEREEA